MTRRPAKAFLQAAGHHIGAPAVAGDLHAADGGGGVHIDQRPDLARDRPDAVRGCAMVVDVSPCTAQIRRGCTRRAACAMASISTTSPQGASTVS
jgi:hypothetical protein